MRSWQDLGATRPTRARMRPFGKPVRRAEKILYSWGIRLLDRAFPRRANLPLEQRIGLAADELMAGGMTAIAALAAAEAIELAREHKIRFDRIEFDDAQLLWVAHYESGSIWRPAWITLPLEHATEATQTGIGSLN